MPKKKFQKIEDLYENNSEIPKDAITYTIILHETRKELDLSLNAYCVADTIYHLSNNPGSEIKGWCFASKKTLGKHLNLSPKTILRHIQILINKDLVEKNRDDSKYIRTTQKWYDNVVLMRIRMREYYDDKEKVIQ